MTLNKKLLAGAIAGLLVSANASAVVLGVDPARVYAAEIEDGTLLTDAADTASFEIGYNFSSGEVRYGRFECSSSLTMDNVTVSTASADVTLGAINGEGTSALFFSMTAGAAPGVTADDIVDVDGDNTLEDGGNVTCAFSIYDQPSQAQAGGTTGRIYTTGNQPFITRAPGFVFETDPTGITQAVADVEDPNGAYFGFEGGGNPVPFGNLNFYASPGVLTPAGAAITLADIFDTDSTVTVEGDMSAATGIGDDSTFTIAPVVGNVATFDAFDTAGFGSIYYFQTGADPIQASEYTATLHAVANAGYEVDDVGPFQIGEIVRNGTQLQAPLAQLPGGWLSRVALTNTGPQARPYEISAMTETGTSATVNPITGSIPAGATVVIDLADIVTFTGKQRGTINVAVAAPTSQIQGLYQIVNPASGSISNHVMVRPGSN
jgi:hypothetical protein